MAVRSILLLCLLALVIGACKEHKPEKISKITSLTAKSDGTHVEFGGWINSTAGDKDVGIELHMSDTPDTFPQAFVELKDGEKDPGEKKLVCISGELQRKDDLSGSTILWIKEGVVINCY